MDGARTVREVVDAVATAHPTVRRETTAEEVKSCTRRYGVVKTG